MRNKTVLFTFDYELFLGERSGSAGECILGPTRRLMDLFKRFAFKGIFFVDTVYLIRLQEMADRYPAAAADYAAIRQQLTDLMQDGHAVFPHIHAHWLDAVYLSDRNEWSLTELRYYAFSALTPERQQSLFDGSVAVLRAIADEVDPGYKIDGYRAGGWSIQPFDDFRPHFLRHQIVHEWSVIPGRYQFSDAHRYDFRKAPAGPPVYRFDTDVCHHDEGGPFKEWTISCLELTAFQRWLDFKVSGMQQRLRGKDRRKGSTVSSTVHEAGDTLETAERKRILASFEALTPYRVRRYRKAVRKASYYQFISHPKLLSDRDLVMLERLLRDIKKDPTVVTDFREAAEWFDHV